MSQGALGQVLPDLVLWSLKVIKILLSGKALRVDEIGSEYLKAVDVVGLCLLMLLPWMGRLGYCSTLNKSVL